MKIVLLGAPGSGKGTQGAALAAHFGVPHISSGELLRQNIAERTELGKQVEEYLARGDFVPDELALAMIGDAVAGADGYVLDGFPRTLAQASRAFSEAKKIGLVADAVVYLKVPDEVARKRLELRGEDDRIDDANQAAVDRRLQLFHSQTEPLLEYYGNRGILHTIDATQPKEAVTAQILEALGVHRR